MLYIVQYCTLGIFLFLRYFFFSFDNVCHHVESLPSVTLCSNWYPLALIFQLLPWSRYCLRSQRNLYIGLSQKTSQDPYSLCFSCKIQCLSKDPMVAVQEFDHQASEVSPCLSPMQSPSSTFPWHLSPPFPCLLWLQALSSAPLPVGC